MRAAIMLVLSSAVSAARASACSIPARSNTSRSMPPPATRSPGKSGPRRSKASGFTSTTATAWLPRASDPAAAPPDDSLAPFLAGEHQRGEGKQDQPAIQADWCRTENSLEHRDVDQ